MEELFAEVDENDNVLAVYSKERLKELRFRHRLVLIVPKAKEGKFIFAKRAKVKFPFPDVWVFGVGGKVRAGETYEEAAIRETEEEIGIKLNVEEVATSKLDLAQEKAIAKIFTTKEIMDLEEFRLDHSEIDYVEAFTVKEMEEIIQNKPESFAPTFIRHFKVFADAYKLK